jgi:Domain of unknown function (DUF4360)
MIKQVIYWVLIILFSNGAIGNTRPINNVPMEIISVSANGSGCSAGTVNVTVSNTEINILFASYKAVTNAENTLAVAECNISIMFSVPPGYSIGITGIDWVGLVLAASGAFVNFHRELFFEGQQRPTEDTNWVGSGFEYFTITDDSVLGNHSRCDGSPITFHAVTKASIIGANSSFSLEQAAKIVPEIVPCQ